MKKLLLLGLLICSTAASVFAGGPAIVTQKNYRWRNDNGDETSATWSAPVNTPSAAAMGQTVRLRLSLMVTDPDVAVSGGNVAVPLGLQYATSPSGPFVAVALDPSDPFIMSTSTLAGYTSTTNQMSSPSPYASGLVSDANSFGSSMILSTSTNATQYVEIEYVLQPTSNAQATTYYFRSSAAGAYENIAQLTVVPPQSLVYPGSPYCSSTGSGLPFNSNASGGTYSSDAGLMINATTGTVDIATSSAGTHTVTYTYNGGSTATTSIVIRPQATNTAAMNPAPNQVLCSGASTAPTAFSNTVPGVTYNWTSSNAIGVPASGTGDLPSYTLTNNGTMAQTSTITVAPTGGTGCLFKRTVFRYTVNPTPTVDAVADQFYCRGTVTNAVTFTGAVAGTSYIWGTSQPLSGMPQRKGTNVFPSFTTGNTTGSTVVTVTPSFNKCLGTATSFTVQINNCTTQAGGTGAVDARTSLDQQLVAGPNPTTGVVRVQYSGTAQQLDVLVRDAYGTILMPVRRVSSSNIQIDLSSLRPGNYSVQFADPRTGTFIVRTIIKL